MILPWHGQNTVFLEFCKSVGIEHFGPFIAVVACGISAGKDVEKVDPMTDPGMWANIATGAPASHSNASGSSTGEVMLCQAMSISPKLS